MLQNLCILYLKELIFINKNEDIDTRLNMKIIREEFSKDGNEILVVVKDDVEYRLNSSYRPIAEAEKFAKQFEVLEEGSLLFVFGFGNGMFADEILKVCKSNVTIVFYEPCLDIVKYVSMKRDLELYCRQHNCFLVMNKGNEMVSGGRLSDIAEFYDTLQDIMTYNNRDKMYQAVLPKYRELFVEEYRYFVDILEQGRDELFTQINNARDYGHILVENNVKLLRYIPQSYCLHDFKDIFPKDMPAIIVSAGPSLEKNVHLLHEAKGHALILCVDAAIKFLLQEDIIPDMIVTIDARKEISLFEDERLKNIPMIGHSDMSNKVLDMVRPNKFILAGTNNDYIKNLYDNIGKSQNIIDFGGSVATAACAICKEIGFETIILVGQDLALTGEKMYAGKEKVALDKFGRQLINVEALDGSIVKTTTDYYSYIKWFERLIEKYPTIHIIDATEGGAKIEGSEILTLKDTLKRYAVAEYEIKAIIDSVEPAFLPEQREQLIKQFKQEKDVYDIIIQKMKRGVILASQGVELSIQKQHGKMEQFDKINAEMTEICGLCDRLNEFSLIKSEIDATELENFAGVFDSSKYGMSIREQYQKMKKFFSCMQKAAQTVRQIFDEVQL